MFALRRAVYIAATFIGAILAMGQPALADPDPNDHNCEGVVVSELTPGFVSRPPGGFGEFVSGQGKDASRGDFVRSFNGPLANCGSHGVDGEGSEP